MPTTNGAIPRGLESRCNSTDVVHNGGRSPAQQLVEAVRNRDAFTIRRITARPDIARIALELATEIGGPKSLRPHGTHAAFNRHKNNGEEPCQECRVGERTYQRLRARRDREAARQMALFDGDNVVDGCQKHPSVDPVVIDRACDLAQPLPPLNRAEKACAYKEMDRRRVPRNEIARRLRISGTTARTFAEMAAEGAPSVGVPADDERMETAS